MSVITIACDKEQLYQLLAEARSALTWAGDTAEEQGRDDLATSCDAGLHGIALVLAAL